MLSATADIALDVLVVGVAYFTVRRCWRLLVTNYGRASRAVLRLFSGWLVLFAVAVFFAKLCAPSLSIVRDGFQFWFSGNLLMLVALGEVNKRPSFEMTRLMLVWLFVHSVLASLIAIGTYVFRPHTSIILVGITFAILCLVDTTWGILLLAGCCFRRSPRS